MASQEHRNLAEFIKTVHSKLRTNTTRIGAKLAWKEHLKDEETLSEYSKAMKQLATQFWDSNFADDKKEAVSRVKWTLDLINDYFLMQNYIKYRLRDEEIAEKLSENLCKDSYSKFEGSKIKLLDVGSCYNPLSVCNNLDVLAIDLCPANDKVLKCDFLEVELSNSFKISNNEVLELQTNSFDVITFLFLLEYLPTSEQRILACSKAHGLLKKEGILIICTPDSKHVGANAKLLKSWRYTLAKLGLSRIKYEKMPHMHCLVFRKCLSESICERWIGMQKESFKFEICIPQDFRTTIDKHIKTEEIKNSFDIDFSNMPGFDVFN